MKIHFRVMLLITLMILRTGLSDKTQTKVGKDNASSGSEKLTQIIRDDLGRVSEKNDIGGIPISNFAASHGATIEDILYDEKNGYGYQGRGEFRRNDYQFGFDAGNPDVHGELRRPCQAYDTFCIRKFFAEHSNCKISGRALPDPLYRAQGSVHFASNNMSETQVGADYGGLNNARVSEFYINKATDNLVIAITFDSATKYSNNTYFKYYLRGREPIVTRDVGAIRYGVLTVTAIIPQLNNLRLDRSEIYTYGDDNIFSFFLGPGIGASTDPDAASMYARFYTNIPVEYQEEISSQGNYMVANFIQYNICDFGIKVV